MLGFIGQLGALLLWSLIIVIVGALFRWSLINIGVVFSWSLITKRCGFVSTVDERGLRDGFDVGK